MAKGQRRPKPVILGIDVGSTATRACLLASSPTYDVIEVENKERNNCSKRYELGDFSSDGYPFDANGPAYLGESPDTDRRAISLKYGMYLLANASDGLLSEYSLVQPLLRHKNDPSFIGRLRQGLEGLFSTLHKSIRAICNKKKLVITEIGLTVPAQWTLEFEDIYRDLVARIFNHPRQNIFFYTETEALAHYLLKHNLDELQQDEGSEELQQDEKKMDVILFLDFGGHNMNGCIFKVLYGDDGTASFYRIGDSFGAGGGSEQWEYNVGVSFVRGLERASPYRMSEKALREILDQFNSQKPTLGPGTTGSFKVLCVPVEESMPWVGGLDHGIINRCFEDAMQGPLGLAATKIKEISNIPGVTRHVVISGGTSRHQVLQARIRSYCAEAGLQDPIFTHQSLEIRYESIKIAKGAAYATANHLTMSEFMRRGAAFAVQVRQRKQNGNRGRLWDNIACFLLDINRQKVQRIHLMAGDELRLVCNPFCNNKADTDILDHDDYYDLYYLGRIHKRGYWSLSLSLTGGDDAPKLVLERTWRASNTKHKRSTFPVDRLELPLYFDRGNNCVHVGRLGMALSDLGLEVQEAGLWSDGDEEDGEGEEWESDTEISSSSELDDGTGQFDACWQALRFDRRENTVERDGTAKSTEHAASVNGAKPWWSLSGEPRVDPFRRQKRTWSARQV